MSYQPEHTSLYPAYKEYGGIKLIDFGGWELPVNFAAGISAEHQAVRRRAGLFDVSHMGEIVIEGTGAEAYLEGLVTGNIASLETGRCLYTVLCYPEGGAVDDLVVYRLAQERFLLVVNAANTARDFTWIDTENPEAKNRASGLIVRDQSADWFQIALQGPKAEEYLQGFVTIDLEGVPFYGFVGEVRLDGTRVLISRTGYTGEQGFEIYGPARTGPAVWNTLMDRKDRIGLLPCGLGARDTLRLEARLPLYGHELSPEAGPLEGGIKMFVDFSKDFFIGKDALERLAADGNYRVLRGVVMTDKGVPRQGYPVYFKGSHIGEVTSGGKSPSLDEFIAVIRVPKGTVVTGDPIEIEINGRRKGGTIVKTPFYQKAYGGKT